MEYSYVEPAPPSPLIRRPEVPAPERVVIQVSHRVEPDHPHIPREAARLYRSITMRRTRLFYSQAYSTKLRRLVHAVSLRTYDLATGEPLGWGMWVDGAAAGAMIFTPRPTPCNMTQFKQDLFKEGE